MKVDHHSGLDPESRKSREYETLTGGTLLDSGRSRKGDSDRYGISEVPCPRVDRLQRFSISTGSTGSARSKPNTLE